VTFAELYRQPALIIYTLTVVEGKISRKERKKKGASEIRGAIIRRCWREREREHSFLLVFIISMLLLCSYI
jgi:hypothetical protein